MNSLYLINYCTFLIYLDFVQDLIAAATGMNTGAISDPQQKKQHFSTFKGPAKETKEVTSPMFLVTQTLVSLLTQKGIRHRQTPERADTELKGERLGNQTLIANLI